MKNSSGLQFKVKHKKRHVFCLGHTYISRTGGGTSPLYPPPLAMNLWLIRENLNDMFI